MAVRQHAAPLAALDFYRAVARGDERAQLAVLDATEPGEVFRGLLTVLDSVVVSLATVHGLLRTDLVDVIRSQYQVANMLQAVQR